MLKNILSVFVIIILFSGTSCASDTRVDKSILKIMTLNAEFMWDGVVPEEGQVVFEWKNSQTEAEEHMQEVAEIIIRNNPDIVNLVEIENKDALDTLNNNYLQGRGYKVYFDKGKDTYTGQDMGLLTRIDPENNSIQHDNRKGVSGTLSKSVSKNYVSTFDIDGRKLCIIGLHFLSRPSDTSRKLKREAQADAIRSMAIEKLNQGYAMIILGDFNDYDGETGSKDHIDSTPITSVLSMIKGMNPNDTNDDLINVSSFIPKATRYTAFWDANRNSEINRPNEFTSIDHILLSPNLATLVNSVDIPHDYDPRFVTDHFPVVVRLQLNSTTTNQIRITALIPNPSGNENQNEEITIKNFNNHSISVVGWIVKDLAGYTWKLDSLGTLAANTEKTIKRSGQAMALNNKGDTVDLINSSGTILQTVTYTRALEEEVIYPVN